MYRVLVADDEIEFRKWLRSLLDHSEEFAVVGEAGSGMEAVLLIQSLLPDLIIADMYMPEQDGLELARYVQHNYPQIRAIVTSAYEERVYSRMAKVEGALAFIPKSKLSLATLRQALQEEERP
ncbi:MAG: response regulator [Dehalococcoidia bacterium]|nr:response regulator [Dehalococcoidia bacterium]